MLRYYRLEKQAQQGQTLIALFHPRGAPMERVVASIPRASNTALLPMPLLDLLQRAQVPRNVQGDVSHAPQAWRQSVLERA